MNTNTNDKLQAVNALIQATRASQLVTVVAGLPQLVERFKRLHQNEEMAQVAEDFVRFIGGELVSLHIMSTSGKISYQMLVPLLSQISPIQHTVLKAAAMRYLTQVRLEAQG